MSHLPWRMYSRKLKVHPDIGGALYPHKKSIPSDIHPRIGDLPLRNEDMQNFNGRVPVS